MQVLRTKSIESIKEKDNKENKTNPNPYIRRFGSHIKSHFSQSRCEIFDSSEDEKGSLRNQVGTQMNSMNSMGSMKVEFNRPGYENKSSLQNLDNVKRKNKIKKSNYRLGSTCHVKNNPSIDKGSPFLGLKEKVFGEDLLEEEKKNKFKLDIEEGENDTGSLLIINKSRKSDNESLNSAGSDTNNLIEPGAELVLQLQNESKNKIKEEIFSVFKEDDQSLNSTANNSVFKPDENKIEEEEQENTIKENQLDIES